MLCSPILSHDNLIWLTDDTIEIMPQCHILVFLKFCVVSILCHILKCNWKVLSFDTMPQVQSDVQQLLLLLFTSFSTLFQLQAPACSVTSVTPMTPITVLTHSTMKMMKLSSLRPWNSWLNVNLMLPSAEKSSKLVRWNLAFYVLYFCHDITFT